MESYWVYMLLCSDDSYYTGVTNNLVYRVDQHQFGFDPKCYTFKRRPLKLVYCAEFHHIDEAIAAEKRIKGWSQAKKQALVENDWPRISRLARNYWVKLCFPDSLSHSSTPKGPLQEAGNV